jgi:hypothetical protein
MVNMKMKLSILLLIVSIVALSSLPSCSKDTVTVVKNDTLTVTVKDTFTTVVNDSSTLGLLTQKQWIFDSVYYSYTGAGTGSLVYARGSNLNSVNLDNARAVFWKDGSEDNFTYNGVYLPLQWSFVNGDSSEIYTPPYSTYFPNGEYARILKLTATYLTLYDSTNSILDIFVYKP